MAEKKEVRPLELSTRQVGLRIKIDGEEYELARPETLEVKDALWLEKMAPKVNGMAKQLRESEEPDDELAARLGDAVLRVCDIILGGVPPAVRAKLTQMQKLSVIAYFMQVEGGGGFFGQAPAGQPSSGGTSSPDSSGSTAGAPGPGSG